MKGSATLDNIDGAHPLPFSRFFFYFFVCNAYNESSNTCGAIKSVTVLNCWIDWR